MLRLSKHALPVSYVLQTRVGGGAWPALERIVIRPYYKV
jgi:hypothetical protein